MFTNKNQMKSNHKSTDNLNHITNQVKILRLNILVLLQVIILISTLNTVVSKLS